MQENLDVSQEQVAWCQRHLGSSPTRVIFTAGHLSVVTGLALDDGREIVVKQRSPASRLNACIDVQQHLWAHGFCCPRPLAGPAPLGAQIATAETFIPDPPPSPSPRDQATLAAEGLAHLITLAPPVDRLTTLAPPPAWLWWQHDCPGLWPPPDDLDVDLNHRTDASWIDDIARRVRTRLARSAAPLMVGHGDWEAQNLRWHHGRLHTVHDWDSITAAPESILVGAAAAVYTANGAPLTEPTIAQSESFLAAYPRPLTPDQHQVSWSAGLWVRAFNAKKETVHSGPHTPETLTRLAEEAPRRLELANA